MEEHMASKVGIKVKNKYSKQFSYVAENTGLKIEELTDLVPLTNTFKIQVMFTFIL